MRLILPVPNTYAVEYLIEACPFRGHIKQEEHWPNKSSNLFCAELGTALSKDAARAMRSQR